MGGKLVCVTIGGSRDSLRVAAEVQAGHRIEISVPELREGQQVDVIVVPRQAEAPTGQSLLEFLDRLPHGPRSAPCWDDVECRFQEERDAWDR